MGCGMKYLYLLVPCVVALFTPLYNHLEPSLLGFPFFYWFQIILIPISSAFIYLAYRGRGR